MQGQFSNDLSGFGPLVTYGLWLDHKGKVQADSFVLRVGPEEFLALSYSSPAADLFALLSKFIIADDVVIADETQRWTGLGAWGEEVERITRDLGISLPPPGEYVRCGNGFAFRGRRSRQANVEVACPTDELPAGWSGQATDEDLECERILGGIPAVPADLGPGDLPNEGGLEDVAISFTKGCFTGQEVMARLKNLGQVRRRLMVIRGPGGPPPRTPLFQRGRKVGETRSAVRDRDGFVGLGMISLLSLDPAAGLSLGPEAPETLMFVSPGP